MSASKNLPVPAPGPKLPTMASGGGIPSPSSQDGLRRYMQEIRRFPMLEPDEEYMLARRWTDHGDVEAAHRMVTSHLRLAAKIAMGFRGYGLPTGDLVSEANIGLMKAVKRFDPEKGFRLATYAMWWIRASVQEYVLRSWSLVKLGTTTAQKKLFFNLRKAKARIGFLEDGQLDPETAGSIARDLGVTEEEVLAMNGRMSGGGDVSLNVRVGSDSEGPGSEWQDMIEDEDADHVAEFERRDEMEYRRALLAKAMDTLSGREREILAERQLAADPVTLDVLSNRFGVSRERIRQIEARAFEKVQKRVRELVMEDADLGAPVLDMQPAALPSEEGG